MRIKLDIKGIIKLLGEQYKDRIYHSGEAKKLIGHLIDANGGSGSLIYPIDHDAEAEIKNKEAAWLEK